jgi:hypothetical protein
MPRQALGHCNGTNALVARVALGSRTSFPFITEMDRILACCVCERHYLGSTEFPMPLKKYPLGSHCRIHTKGQALVQGRPAWQKILVIPATLKTGGYRAACGANHQVQRGVRRPVPEYFQQQEAFYELITSVHTAAHSDLTHSRLNIPLPSKSHVHI